ncbi:probable polygalacturonase At3g15720 isoform X2 [Durio zibethinus]|uniref:Probable polygalacturonase At3g15720 isoform X2 n=1 Tax=Durio zibethinus TaxID=66656 RepID=A0A6P5XU45_DURZI|nr:probable polygalacturonase At3g15720 isoform X2 [Durio zibethinus]
MPCELSISNLHITAPANGPNNGIDISLSTQVLISDSFIGTGNDCIAIKGACDRLYFQCDPGWSKNQDDASKCIGMFAKGNQNFMWN